MDIIFAGATGFPSSSQVITLINGFTDGQIGDVIVKGLGSIATRLDNGLSGYWHLDEGIATTTYDASGYGNNGTLINSPTWTSGSACKVGSCLSLNGSMQYVNAGTASSLNTSGAISITLWVKAISIPSHASNQHYVTSKLNWPNSGWWMRFTNEPRLNFSVMNSGAEQNLAAASVTSLNRWYFVAITATNNSAMKMYIDGVLSNSIPSVVLTAATSSGFLLSTSSDDYDLNGLIDEVKIYNRALSASEILAAYNDLK